MTPGYNFSARARAENTILAELAMQTNFPDADRSARFVLYFQTEGLCEALRLVLQSNSQPGPGTIQVLRALTDQAKEIGKGEPFKRLLEITESSPPADLLVAAELLRTTVLAHLSPEEINEQRQSFGFAAR
jgi:hypothetical protein